MNKDSRIYVAGHNGLAGSSIARELGRRGYKNIVTADRSRYDLRIQDSVFGFFALHEPEYVFLAAAHAGGIGEATHYPVEMLSDNLRIQDEVISACHLYNVKKLLFLGSSCMYPVNGLQPYKEEMLGSGRTDENWSYAIAKLAGIELCRAYHTQYGCDFITAIPCNLYGSHDNFDVDKSHVIPALMANIHDAKVNNKRSVEAWGDGHVRREFLHTDDFARACVMLMEDYDYDALYDGVVNLGTGNDISIIDLTVMIRDIIGYEGQIKFNGDTPGVKSKLLDCSGISALGWSPTISLREGLEGVYNDYKDSTYRQPC